MDITPIIFGIDSINFYQWMNGKLKEALKSLVESDSKYI